MVTELLSWEAISAVSFVSLCLFIILRWTGVLPQGLLVPAHIVSRDGMAFQNSLPPPPLTRCLGTGWLQHPWSPGGRRGSWRPSPGLTLQQELKPWGPGQCRWAQGSSAPGRQQGTQLRSRAPWSTPAEGDWASPYSGLWALGWDSRCVIPSFSLWRAYLWQYCSDVPVLVGSSRHSAPPPPPHLPPSRLSWLRMFSFPTDRSGSDGWEHSLMSCHPVLSRTVVSNSLWPVDDSSPGSSVHGILQARILEWVAISSCRGSSPPRDWNSDSCSGRQILYPWSPRRVPREQVELAV